MVTLIINVVDIRYFRSLGIHKPHVENDLLKAMN